MTQQLKNNNRLEIFKIKCWGVGCLLGTRTLLRIMI